MDDDNVISLPTLPLHAVSDSGATRGRGRPPKVEVRPGRDDLEYHAQMLAERAHRVEADEIVQAALQNASPQELLHLVMHALAADAALLAHARDELAKRGRDVAQITSRRATLLDRIASLTIEAERRGVGLLDPHSEPMQRVFALWVQHVVAVATEVLQDRRETLDLFIETLARRCDGWEERLEAQLR